MERENQGVYLVLKGEVCLSVQDLEQYDRIFPAGSLLGIPATFTGHHYSLAAVTVNEAEVLHPQRRPVLDLMARLRSWSAAAKRAPPDDCGLDRLQRLLQ